MKPKRWRAKDFLKAAVTLPFAFWAMYWFEHGFNWVTIIIGAVLCFIIVPALIVMWDT